MQKINARTNGVLVSESPHLTACCRADTTGQFSIKFNTCVISGSHRALLQPITFISRLNAPDYTKLRG